MVLGNELVLYSSEVLSSNRHNTLLKWSGLLQNKMGINIGTPLVSQGINIIPPGVTIFVTKILMTVVRSIFSIH